MYSHQIRRSCVHKAPQQGAALLVFLVLLVLAGLFLLVQWGAQPRPAAQMDSQTQATMNRVKQALVAYAARRVDTAKPRPGELPCPDTTSPLSPNTGTADGGCDDNKIGRIPWRTLGIPKPVDATGEVLWYALDGNFKYALTSSAQKNSPINTATQAHMRVMSQDGAQVLAPAVVAVIFAANAPLANQSRGSDVAFCPVRNAPISKNACPENYLDSQSGIHNGRSTTGVFIQGAMRGGNSAGAQATLPFNDVLMWVTTEDLMPSVEQMVLANVKNVLSTSKPYPAAPGALTYVADANRCTGFLPQEVIDKMPSWFELNDWKSHIGYGMTGGTTCASQYRLPDGRGVEHLLFGHGAVRSGQSVDFVNRLESNQNVFVDNDQFSVWGRGPDMGNDQILGW